MSFLFPAELIAEFDNDSARGFSTPETRNQRIKQALVWLVVPATFCLAITRQSLWIDEGYTVWFVSHKSFSSFMASLIGGPGTLGDAQLLFYMVWLWGWVKLFGLSEVALRAANIPFALLLMGTMSWASRRLLWQPHAWVIFCISPFLWFYLNEARPYVGVMTFATIAVVALLAYLLHPLEYRKLAPWYCLLALFLCWGMHILAFFVFPAMLVLVATTAIGDPVVRQNFLRDWSRAMLWCSPAFIGLGAFYIGVSFNGVNTSEGKPGLSNLAYAAYEFIGFGGLGPTRNDIRKTPHIVVFAPYWPWLLVGATALVALGIFLLRTPPPRMVWNLAVSLMVGSAIGLKICRMENFQIWGRHMAVFFPMFLMTLMLWSKRCLSSRHSRFSPAVAAITIVIAWSVSDARLSFVHKYEKDDYRSAASIAMANVRQNSGEILWAADPHAAHYYGIQVMRGQDTPEIGKTFNLDLPVTTRAIDATNWNLDKATKFLDERTVPTLLVLSKADLFDRRGAWGTLVRHSRPTEVAHLNGFSIYEWRPQATAR